MVNCAGGLITVTTRCGSGQARNDFRSNHTLKVVHPMRSYGTCMGPFQYYSSQQRRYRTVLRRTSANRLQPSMGSCLAYAAFSTSYLRTGIGLIIAENAETPRAGRCGRRMPAGCPSIFFLCHLCRLLGGRRVNTRPEGIPHYGRVQ